MMQCRLDHIFSKQMADIIIEKFEEYLRSKNEEMNHTLKRLETQVAEIDAKIENLSDVLADGVDRRQRNMILSKMEKLEDERTALQEYVAQERVSMMLDIPDREELKRYFLEAQTMFRERRLEEMQQLIDLYVEKVIVHEGEVEVILNLVPLFYRQDFTEQIYTVNRVELMGRDYYFKKNHNIPFNEGKLKGNRH